MTAALLITALKPGERLRWNIRIQALFRPQEPQNGQAREKVQPVVREDSSGVGRAACCASTAAGGACRAAPCLDRSAFRPGTAPEEGFCRRCRRPPQPLRVRGKAREEARECSNRCRSCARSDGRRPARRNPSLVSAATAGRSNKSDFGLFPTPGISTLYAKVNKPEFPA
jgi:hypothetical protein